MDVIHFYVPSTNAEQEDAGELEQRIDQITAELAALTGGGTAIPADAIPARGFWVSPDVGFIKEAVTIVQTFSRDNILAEVQAIADKYQRAWGQEAMLFVYNGVPHGI